MHELDVILSHKVGPNIYNVDDLRLFDKLWDWKGITPASIVKKFRDYGHEVDSYFISNDRFYVMIS